ncbi:MAG: 3'-5' exonuclease, partial [Caldimonas sp.]
DMADLERGALALLRDADLAGWIQERLDVRIAHVLIDEFQDTSPLQWHALHAWLSAYAGAGGGASGQRTPGIFIVGDPKQSIYRFRRAEPRVFAAAARFVGEGLGGSVLTCDHTRRNTPAVVAAINAVFSSVPAASFAGFRPHTTEVEDDPTSVVLALPRTAREPRVARPAGSGPAPTWRDSLTAPRLEPEEVLREREAGAVAAAIAQWRRTGAMSGGTAAGVAGGAPATFVLCRKRESLRLVATALEAERVGHGAVEDAVLAAAPEAQDLIAVVDALVSPTHRLSLARALRSPLFGASDGDLLAVAECAAEHGDWWGALEELEQPGPALERARRLLQRWRVDATRLPPHDLLDRIVHEGELRERLAAAVPPDRRALALDAVDGVLAQALLLDGGRYATPYGFVRALKRRLVKMPPPLRGDAVRLLTVHGAKGLEADTVFIVDADPERATTETATVLVEWPVEAERPTRVAFVYSESRCPPSLQPVLERERQAREREELNGLYVAMTRARRRLVFSATEPYLAPLNETWWQRVAAVAAPWPASSAAGHGEATGDAAPAEDPGAQAGGDIAVLKVLPTHGRARPVPSAGREDEPADPSGAADLNAAQLGRAVHRVLEWAGREPCAAGIDGLAEAAASAFGVEARAVGQFARAVLEHPQTARFFRGVQIRWSGNEVPIGDAGQALRIDRLVLLDGDHGLEWWVLDYKLGLAPDRLDAYRRQLLRYCDAVRAAQPGERVRCAFVSGNGEVIEVT